MKVMIASISAGYGHHATAAALEGALSARGAVAEVVDLFKYISYPLYKTVDAGYAFSARHTPRQFGRMYRIMERDNALRRTVSALLSSDAISGRVFELFSEKRPDVVLTTHIFASLAIDQMQRQGILKCRHIGVMTDYTIHPFWEDVAQLERLIVCSEQIYPRALRRGISQDKLLALGIPVEERYTRSVPQEEARKALGIAPDLPTVLLMSGSMGFGNMSFTVDHIAKSGEKLQMLCVCGKNDKLRTRLERMRFEVPVKVYGFVNNIDLMMDAADIVVTKPGGLSTTEALVKGKPLILTSPIPGQEEENNDYLLNLGLAMCATSSMPVYELVILAMRHPAMLARIRENIRTFVHTDATERVCEYVFHPERFGTTLRL